jgi:hypothetical protein
MPCCFALLVDGPCYPTIAPCYYALLVAGPCHSSLLLAFFGYLLPPIVALLPYCCALSIGTPSPLFFASGGTWINTNKLHPTIKVFLFFNFLGFFFLCFVFCLFVLFLFVIFFELNTFCFSEVCEF